MNFLFRVDSGYEIGVGHVMRCLALALLLRDRGHIATFLCKEHEGSIADVIRDNGFICASIPICSNNQGSDHDPWLGSSQIVDAGHTIREIENLGYTVDWLVVDHYSIAAEWERSVWQHCGRLMVIDDLANRVHRCDLLLDQTPGVDEARYRTLVPEHCSLALGAGFILLRPEFHFEASDIRKRREAASRAQRKKVLVMMGGCDHLNLSLKVLRAIFGHPNVESITVVVGVSAPHTKELKQFCEMQPKIDLLIGCKNVSEIMFSHDIAIGAPGGASWERCSAGLPSILVTFADNQRLVADQLTSIGAALRVGVECNPKELVAAIDELCHKDFYMKVSDAARSVCDGLGVQRVAGRILQLSANDSQRDQ